MIIKIDEHGVVHAENDWENLCGHCLHEFPTCNPKVIEFGTGLGCDNVCACDTYDDGNNYTKIKQEATGAQNKKTN
jgi:hypothetical protein